MTSRNFQHRHTPKNTSIQNSEFKLLHLPVDYHAFFHLLAEHVKEHQPNIGQLKRALSMNPPHREPTLTREESHYIQSIYNDLSD